MICYGSVTKGFMQEHQKHSAKYIYAGTLKHEPAEIFTQLPCNHSVPPMQEAIKTTKSVPVTLQRFFQLPRN